MEHMRRNSSLHVLGYCISVLKTGFSTWAPDWSEVYSRSPLSSLASAQHEPGQSEESPLFSAGGDSPPSPVFTNGGSVLVLQSIPIDEIVYVASAHVALPFSFELRQKAFGQLYEFAAIMSADPRICRIIDRAGWQFSLAEGQEQFKIPVYTITEENILTTFARTIVADIRTNANTFERQRLGHSGAVANISFQAGWTFAVSSSGFFCRVPVEASLGDKIVVVKGRQVPLLLRPQQDKFQLVGECYVHGIMDGEAIAGADNTLEEMCVV